MLDGDGGGVGASGRSPCWHGHPSRYLEDKAGTSIQDRSDLNLCDHHTKLTCTPTPITTSHIPPPPRTGPLVRLGTTARPFHYMMTTKEKDIADAGHSCTVTAHHPRNALPQPKLHVTTAGSEAGSSAAVPRPPASRDFRCSGAKMILSCWRQSRSRSRPSWHFPSSPTLSKKA